jgi:hypothetical protein
MQRAALTLKIRAKGIKGIEVTREGEEAEDF